MVVQGITTDQTFKLGVSLTQGAYNPSFDKSFEEVLDNKAKEVKKENEAKGEQVAKEEPGIKSKKQNLNELPNISKLMRGSDNKQNSGVQQTYTLLEKFKSERKSQQDDPFRNAKQKHMGNPHNAIGQALIQPINNQDGGRRPSRSQLLAMWEKLTPSVTEDLMKKSIRIDIPMVNDVQALVLRMNPDRTISASLLGSEIMQDLIRKNKDKLDNNLRMHHLKLKEFNTYVNEVDFTSYSGTKKKKSQKKAKLTADLF